ncbi:pre-mRNA-splicing factor cwc22 [Dimargaris verticillata]|uniref:Pre-mRNA-splicing factor cwc22 n=1 Tax=Dimargaris verticillata TaxID=2761393 RepID=A0A9W8B4K3_9FUNG|nr:pre-mRNA-splicing factor cwc22 [Dimargaris verticillata]
MPPSASPDIVSRAAPSPSPPRIQRSPLRSRRRHRETRSRTPDSSRSRSRSNSRDRHAKRSRTSRHRSSYRSSRQSRSRSQTRRYRQRRRSPSSSRSRSRLSPPRSPPQRAPKPTHNNASQNVPTMVPSGGVYIPPARLRQMQAQITDPNTEQYQRIRWDALKKSLNGLINKVNTANIKDIIFELLSENLIRGRGLFARAVLKAQAASPTFTPVYAALVAVVNTKLPMVGELILTRLVLQFRRAFKRNDKANCLATTQFIAHLTNQGLANEILAFQLLQLLFDNPTDDSVEMAVGFMKECGAYLSDIAPKVAASMFEILRSVLHEADIDPRVQYMIEALMQIRKQQFKDYPPIPEQLDIVDDGDQIVHEILLDDPDLQAQDQLNVFTFDPEYEADETKYKQFKASILGSDDDDDDDDSSAHGSGEASGSSDDDSDSHHEEPVAGQDSATKAVQMAIQDRTGTDLINLRRTIYLTIMSSANFEEGVHKLMQLKIQPGNEIELCNMIIECCAQERTYLKFYGLIGERFCKLNRHWALAFEQCFVDTYEAIHRFETNKLRNVAKYFAHLFATDGLPWAALSIITLTEEATTSSSRIFIKILLLEITEALGLPRLNDRLKDPSLIEALQGLFPTDSPKNTRFAINYYTSIGLGALTVELREHLKSVPQRLLAQLDASGSEGDSESTSGSDTGSDSSTGSYASSSSYDSRSVSTHSSQSRSRDRNCSRYRRRSP